MMQTDTQQDLANGTHHAPATPHAPVSVEALRSAAAHALRESELANEALYQASIGRRAALLEELEQLNRDLGMTPETAPVKSTRKPAKRPARAAKNRGVSDDTVLAAMKKAGKDGIAAAALRKALSVSPLTMRHALVALREAGKVKMLGKNKSARWVCA